MSPEYLAPGVVVEEVSFRQKTIEGVSTSTTGFVGPTRFGPILGEPPLLTSYSEFERIYGGLDLLRFEDDGEPVANYMAHAVRAYFEEGGALQVSEDAAAEACVEGFGIVPGLMDLVKDLGLAPNSACPGLRAAACELVLEGLAGEKRISRTEGGYGRARHEGPKGPGGSFGFEGF